MSKIALNHVASISDTVTAANTINNDMDTIQTAMDNTLSRDGTAPNQMLANLDMNSMQILNLPSPATSNSPLRLQDLSSFIGGGTISNIPSGGTTGQVLSKNSNTSYDTKWSDSVTSVGLAMPADFTVSNSPVTTTGNLTASYANTPTGSGGFVRQTSPSLTTPNIGAATATTVNKVTITQPVTGSTLTIADGKTLTANNSLTFAGTDSTTQTFQASDTIVGRATTDTLTNKTISGSSNTLSNIALSSHATQAGNTLVGNFTTSSAAPTATDISTLTSKASPAGTDLVLISDQAASGALKKATVSSLAGSAGVSSINGQTGSLVNYYQPQGRLTLSTGVPVMTSTVSGATTVFYTPYVGNLVPIYDGTNMVPTVVTEISQATTDTTKSPAAVAASKVYDIFVWNDSGTIRATRGPAWTNSTTRGYTLTMTNGILLNTSAITNGPGALRGTFVGTIASNGSSTIDYIFGAGASGGTAALLNVWNTYNRVLVATTVTDTGTSYTYTSNVTRQARASAGNQIGWVAGLAEDGVQYAYTAQVAMTANQFTQGSMSVGQDSTTTKSGSAAFFDNPTASIYQQTFCTTGTWAAPGIGSHFIAALEVSDNTHANTFNAGADNTLSATLRM